MDGTMYGWSGSNYMMICKTKYKEDLIIYIFLSITVREGGGGVEFTINTTKHCLFRLIELQPVDSFFGCWWKVLSFFIRLHAGAFCSVWNCISCLSLFSIFHFLFTNFVRRPFSENVIQASLHLIRIINRLHDANEPLAKDIFRLCPDLPIQKKPGYLEFCKMGIFVLFDYAVSISFRTINWSR